MSKSTTDELVEVLRETRELLARPDNNFIWSYWDSATDALLEFDAFITQIESGDTSDGLTLSCCLRPPARFRRSA